VWAGATDHAQRSGSGCTRHIGHHLGFVPSPAASRIKNDKCIAALRERELWNGAAINIG
jgi:hypothetical protein